jgi:hypothetical protein
MSTLVDDLKRAEYEFYEENIEVMALVDRSGENAIRFEGMHLILVKNNRTLVPLWVAEILEQQELVSIPIDDSTLLEELDIINSRENQGKLSKIDKNLYSRVKKELKILRNNSNRQNAMRYRSLYDYYNAIIEKRARKIVTMFSYQDIEDNQAIRDLPAEERWLLNRINEIYTVWKRRIGREIQLEIMSQSSRDREGHLVESTVEYRPMLMEIELNPGMTIDIEYGSPSQQIELKFTDDRITIPSYFVDGEDTSPQERSRNIQIVPQWLGKILVERGYGKQPKFDALDSSTINIEDEILAEISCCYAVEQSESETIELIHFDGLEDYLEKRDQDSKPGQIKIGKDGKSRQILNFSLKLPETLQVGKRLPLWVIEILDEKGVIVVPEKIHESNPRNFIDELNDFIQGKSSRLFTSSYYRWVRKEIESLSKHNTDPEIIRLNRLESYLETLLRRKAREIVSKFPFDQEGLDMMYTGETKWMIIRYIELIKEWKKLTNSEN